MVFSLLVPIAIGLASAFFLGTSDYVSRGVSEKIGSYKTAALNSSLSFLAVLFLLPLFPGNVTSPALVITMVAASVVGFGALNLVYRALQVGTISVVAPIINTYPAIATVLSIILLGESFSLLKGISLVTIMVGVLLTSTRLDEVSSYFRSRRSKLAPGIVAAVFASVFWGVSYLGIAAVTPTFGPIVPVVFLRGISAMMAFTLAPVLRQKVRPERKNFSKSLLIIVASETFGIILVNFGILNVEGEYSIIATLASLAGAFTIGYALVFLRERPTKNQLLGIFLAFVGIVSLFYFASP